MGLARAASWFARTNIDGWSVDHWDVEIAKGALFSCDESVTPSDFERQARILRIHKDFPLPEGYSVVRVGSVPYLLGTQALDFDIVVEGYSDSFLVRSAPIQCDVIGFIAITKASGVKSGLTEQAVGTYHCALDRVSVQESSNFKETRFSQVEFSLPSDCPVTVDHEIDYRGQRYSVDEVFDESGFRKARGVRK